MSNYPPGVTGNEYQIAGPDYEEDSDELCLYPIQNLGECGAETSEQGYQGKRWLTCYAKEMHVTDLPSIEPDGDRQRDEQIDRERG